jgi:hypothetical protein
MVTSCDTKTLIMGLYGFLLPEYAGIGAMANFTSQSGSGIPSPAMATPRDQAPVKGP